MDSDVERWRTEISDRRRSILASEALLSARRAKVAEELISIRDERSRLDVACNRRRQEARTLKPVFFVLNFLFLPGHLSLPHPPPPSLLFPFVRVRVAP